VGQRFFQLGIISNNPGNQRGEAGSPLLTEAGTGNIRPKGGDSTPWLNVARDVSVWENEK